MAAVAVGHKTFQSSEMDDKSAECAVTPPYVFPAKTRREVDPWWEIDFGRGYRIHSISFLIATGIKQDLGLHIILLQRPYGRIHIILIIAVKKYLRCLNSSIVIITTMILFSIATTTTTTTTTSTTTTYHN